MADSKSAKAALRAQMRAARDDYVAHMSSADKKVAFSVAPSPLFSLFSAGKTVAGYIPIGTEASPAKLLEKAASMGCKLALPHVTSVIAPMRFLSWQIDEALEDGPYGLKQPAAESPPVSPDIILVPLVAFDRNLNRLGQGAGHYDRALSLLEDAIAIGIAWSAQEQDLLVSDIWDVPLDAILTEKEWITG